MAILSVRLSPEELSIVDSVAITERIPRAEAVRRLVNRAGDGPPGGPDHRDEVTAYGDQREQAGRQLGHLDQSLAMQAERTRAAELMLAVSVNLATLEEAWATVAATVPGPLLDRLSHLADTTRVSWISATQGDAAAILVDRESVVEAVCAVIRNGGGGVIPSHPRGHDAGTVTPGMPGPRRETVWRLAPSPERDASASGAASGVASPEKGGSEAQNGGPRLVPVGKNGKDPRAPRPM